MINATGNMGSAMSPLLFGWLKDLTGSFNAGFYLVAGFPVLGGAGGIAHPDEGQPSTSDAIKKD